MSSAYERGRQQALIKLGMLGKALAGATMGGLAGYVLSPEDRIGQGTLTGIGAGGLGAVLGAKAAPLLHDQRSINSALARAAMPVAGAGLGSLAGLGVSQAFINKDIPDRSEDPYRYTS